MKTTDVSALFSCIASEWFLSSSLKAILKRRIYFL